MNRSGEWLRWVLMAGLAIAAIWGGKKIVSAVRGIRNNNPGNVRLSGTVWAGQVPKENQTDSEFVQFIAPEYGIRAITKIIHSYAARGITSIGAAIETWAPPSENDTESYKRSVEASMSLPTHSADHTLLTPERLPLFISAMIRQENGIQPYDPATIIKGISMA